VLCICVIKNTNKQETTKFSKMNRFISNSAFFIVFFFTVSLTIKSQSKSKNSATPNIIFILADDLGIGDLGCYGQKVIKTPNLDKLAAEGMIFSNHYSGSTVCAPSRSVLMTGQHTGHTSIRDNKGGEVKGSEGQTPMSESSVTIAEVLKKQGYTTGAFGK
jgi:arylsulfatase A-like enzyme